MKKTSEAQLKASKEYRKRIQTDDEKKWHRNKQTTLRSARNHIKNYSDEESLKELRGLIEIKLRELES